VQRYLAGIDSARELVDEFYPGYTKPRFLELCTPGGAPFGWIAIKVRFNSKNRALVDTFFAGGFDYLDIARHIWRAVAPLVHYIMFDIRRGAQEIDWAIPGDLMPERIYQLLVSTEDRGWIWCGSSNAPGRPPARPVSPGTRDTGKDGKV